MLANVPRVGEHGVAKPRAGTGGDDTGAFVVATSVTGCPGLWRRGRDNLAKCLKHVPNKQ